MYACNIRVNFVCILIFVAFPVYTVGSLGEGIVAEEPTQTPAATKKTKVLVEVALIFCLSELIEISVAKLTPPTVLHLLADKFVS